MWRVATSRLTWSSDESALSPRELTVLEMVSTGLTNAEIAERLGVSVHAIKFHLAAVYRKLGVANRTEAAIRFVRSTVATTPPEIGNAQAEPESTTPEGA
jgi:DNA-binding CsgD family transcriptional regulator